MSARQKAMAYTVLKVLVSAVLVVAIAEAGKRSSFLGAVLASVPAVSVLAFVWLYVDTGDVARVADLASGVFWLVLPSLVLFVALPALLCRGWAFWPSLGASLAATVVAYAAMVAALGRFGVRL
ncbi:DUF3147 family protein [Rubrivirga marina]|nr:DUF3147 family protein [Rubrivirga marina]